MEIELFLSRHLDLIDVEKETKLCLSVTSISGLYCDGEEVSFKKYDKMSIHQIFLQSVLFRNWKNGYTSMFC